MLGAQVRSLCWGSLFMVYSLCVVTNACRVHCHSITERSFPALKMSRALRIHPFSPQPLTTTDLAVSLVLVSCILRNPLNLSLI